MFWCNKLMNVKLFDKNSNIESLLKLGIIIGIGLAIHNFPEGLAIGSGFEVSQEFGISIALAICLHDFPEGIAMSIPMSHGGMKKNKVIFYTMLSGLTTGLGALVRKLYWKYFSKNDWCSIRLCGRGNAVYSCI